MRCRIFPRLKLIKLAEKSTRSLLMLSERNFRLKLIKLAEESTICFMRGSYFVRFRLKLINLAEERNFPCVLQIQDSDCQSARANLLKICIAWIVAGGHTLIHLQE